MNPNFKSWFEKQRKTGSRNGNPDYSRTEGSEHLAQAWGWDGQPGRLASSGGPQGPVPPGRSPLPEGRRARARGRTRPRQSLSTAHPVQPAGESRVGGCTAPHRAALPGPRHPARLARLQPYSASRRPRGRTPSPATECPRPSPRHLPQTRPRAATAATRASPQPLSRHVTSGLGPAPARRSQWTLGPADRGRRWESESVRLRPSRPP